MSRVTRGFHGRRGVTGEQGRMPPGQYVTEDFPVLSAGPTPHTPPDRICRGLQVINVALGGTLRQHLPDLVGHDGHSPEVSGYGTHKVSVAPGSQLSSVLGRTEAAVPTHHHQAVERLGSGLFATAWTDDGVIEAVEFQKPGEGSSVAPFMRAVQWHPEASDDLSLFTRPDNGRLLSNRCCPASPTARR